MIVLIVAILSFMGCAHKRPVFMKSDIVSCEAPKFLSIGSRECHGLVPSVVSTDVHMLFPTCSAFLHIFSSPGTLMDMVFDIIRGSIVVSRPSLLCVLISLRFVLNLFVGFFLFLGFVSCAEDKSA